MSCGCCRGWRWRRRAAARSAIHAHGKVEGLALIGGGRKVSAKEVAIEERVLVVATWRAHAVGPAGGRVKRTAREVADRRDIEPVVAFRQTNVQSDNLDHVFTKTKIAPKKSNYRRHCHAPGNQRAAVAFGHALPNFPGRAGNVGILQIVGKDRCHIPSGAAGHVEIVINTGELAFAQRGVALVSKPVDAIKVPVIPKWAGRTCRRPCWRRCRCRRPSAAHATDHTHRVIGGYRAAVPE